MLRNLSAIFNDILLLFENFNFIIGSMHRTDRDLYYVFSMHTKLIH